MKVILKAGWEDNIKVDVRKGGCDVGWWMDKIEECPVAVFGTELSCYWRWV
jgi:hypothetical protein